MYVFLLALGALITASGLALVASGVSIKDHAVDLATVTPGAVAAIGGLILIGLGLAVRLLQRIEQALATRPAARADRPVEVAAITLQPRPNVPAQIAIATTADTNTALPAAAAAVADSEQEPAADPTLEQFRETFSSVVRFGSNPVVPDNDISSPHAPTRLSESPTVASNGYAAGVANGGTPVRIVPQRPEEKPRQVAAQPRRNASVFESLWPKAPRSGLQAQAAAVQIPIPQTAEPEQPAAARLEVVPAAPPQPVPAPTPVSVLKSGVVDGMAYTLYSDGSIEAQLPQGTLRFGSITELRNHIEQES